MLLHVIDRRMIEEETLAVPRALRPKGNPSEFSWFGVAETVVQVKDSRR